MESFHPLQGPVHQADKAVNELQQPALSKKGFSVWIIPTTLEQTLLSKCCFSTEKKIDSRWPKHFTNSCWFWKIVSIKRKAIKRFGNVKMDHFYINETSWLGFLGLASPKPRKEDMVVVVPLLGPTLKRAWRLHIITTGLTLFKCVRRDDDLFHNG